MIVALSQMDHTVAGILTLIGVILFVIAAFWLGGVTPADDPARRRVGVNFVALGLAFVWFVVMWNWFAAS